MSLCLMLQHNLKVVTEEFPWSICSAAGIVVDKKHSASQWHHCCQKALQCHISIFYTHIYWVLQVKSHNV